MPAYATATSVPQGGSLGFRIVDGELPAAVTVRDTASGAVSTTAVVTGPEWSLAVPAWWPSSVYRADFGPSHGEPVPFVVRPAVPAASSPVLVTVPFLTWQAYNRLGVPGEGLYLAEQPDRAVRVSLDRPGLGDAGRYEESFYRWLHANGRPVEYCSGIDLHSGAVPLAGYRLLVIAGHDEYWTAEQRDAVEAFVDAGGNLAVLGGNVCWWQARLEDGLRTMVCYRDGVRDPLSATDPRRATVEWGSAPVNRPENALTGVGFRHGAGCWEDRSVMASAAYTVRFAEHWVFDGTGLRDGDEFGLGAVGYETDAADFVEVDGVPLVTGRDGTPPSFVVLATADLRHWRQYGQGGHATLGVMRRGRGTVFTAATVGWCNRLDDPTVHRITGTVLDRLGAAGPVDEWHDIGSASRVVGLAAAEHALFAVTAGGVLAARDCGAQNLRWTAVGPRPGLRLLTSSREADAGWPVGLFGLFDDGAVRCGEPVRAPSTPWRPVCTAPAGTVALAAAYKGFFAAADDRLWWLPVLSWDGGGPCDWTEVGGAAGILAMTALNGRLFAVTGDGALLHRLPVPRPQPWQRLGSAPGAITLTGHAGWLVAGCADGRLRRREITGPSSREAAAP